AEGGVLVRRPLRHASSEHGMDRHRDGGGERPRRRRSRRYRRGRGVGQDAEEAPRAVRRRPRVRADRGDPRRYDARPMKRDVALEATTCPGTRRENLRPVLESGSGLTAGPDFQLAFSPERVDPGRADWRTKTVPKVIGGIDEASTEAAAALYGSAIDEVHRVS